MRRRRPIPIAALMVAITLGALVHPALALAQSSDAAAQRQRAVEEGLLPPIFVAGEPEPSYTIGERMLYHGVPGVSIAVINDGEVEWAAGYGTLEAGGSDSVAVWTLFQAASISKPVAATAALRLVEEARLDLDGAINDRLRSWQVPVSPHTAARPVTLRTLLTHTAGLTVHGFPGYAAGEAVPGAVEVLNGAGNTDPVLADTVPGSLWRYSGGGYTVAQVAVEDVTNEPFAAAMGRLVLEPLEMSRSTYAQPIPDGMRSAAAVAHRADGTPIDGRWHTYPEQAAAGLWTTPTDLARFALGIRAAYTGEPGAILQQATAREMLSPHMGGWGLGPSVEGTGDSLRFSHGGANEGYRAFFVLYPGSGDGVAVMTNSDAGGAVMMEMVRAVSSVYGWPDYRPRTRTVVDVPAATLAAYPGDYLLPSDDVITVTLDDGQLHLHVPGQPVYPLLAASETSFFPEGDEFRATFVRAAETGVSHLVLRVGGRDIEARRRQP